MVVEHERHEDEQDMLEVTSDHDSQSTRGLDEGEGHKVVEEGDGAQRAKDKHRVRPGIGGGE
eukprot:scaffold6890_cov48-Phaeocystis_antarctica.AAC.2